MQQPITATSGSHLCLLPWLMFLLLFLTSSGTLSAQEHEMWMLSERADVLDNADRQPFFKIPELEASNNNLSVHLFVGEERFKIGRDSVKLRAYTYESGSQSSKVIGPWGPTLRVGADDRMSVTVHNNLPFGGDRNYLASTDLAFARTLDRGEVSPEVITHLVAATRNLIKPGNLKGATMKVIEPGKIWVIYGREECECPPGMEGMCETIPIDYPIEQKYNIGSQKDALRIYEIKDHSSHDHNDPHGFDITNLHVHGWHVSPFQDDIFRRVNPSYSSYYTYDLKNHTPGTFWYHPHVHGSTALQVASGMSGALIIEDPEYGRRQYPNLYAANDNERILIFNQVFYEKETGELDDFNTLMRLRRSGGPPSGTTINGRTVPIIQMRAGELSRWRMIHSGYESALGIYFEDSIEVRQIAVDGIMFKKARTIKSAHFAPGNRIDVVIKIPNRLWTGRPFFVKVYSDNYQDKCEYFPGESECQKSNDNTREVIAYILVTGNAPNVDFPVDLPGPTMPMHSDITTVRPETRKTNFLVDTMRGKEGFFFMVNDSVFNDERIDETLELGAQEEWHVSSSNNRHPYHIHVNPFQVWEYAGRKVDPPMWKDVVMVNKADIKFDRSPPHEGNAKIRSRYTAYWGDFVMHCHILHHEDRGMMQRIRIIRRPK